MGPIPDSLWSVIRHGDVVVDGIALHMLGSRELLGYLQPSLRMIQLFVGNEDMVPALSLGGVERLARLGDPIGRMRVRVETALAANRASIARDACDEAARELFGHPDKARLKLARQASALCSLLLARGIDTRHFLEQIQQHPRAELLLIEAI